jgi:hypothetical protein
LKYVGTLLKKKLSSKSQYIPDLSLKAGGLQFNSQTGESYKIAELGKLDELLDNLGKYDVEHPPLNREIAMRAIRRYLDQIGSCYFLEREDAYKRMDKRKSIGFSAQQRKFTSREDPRMKEFLFKYLDVSAEQVHQCIISASQKDEVRVSTKTPRLFTAFPPEHTFLAQIVLGDFFRQFMNHRFCIDGTPSAIGDPMQRGAMAEYFYQMDKREHKYCSDTKAQDSSIPAEFIHMVYDAIKLKYDLDEKSSRMFEAVRHNSIYKYLNVNGQLFLVPRGLGSGDYLTIIINIIWRYYMILENYKYPLNDFDKDNTVVINGDDLAMSSKYSDLDLNSRHAQIVWEGKPISWDEMEFCSVKFKPFIHHDPVKVLAVMDLRRKREHMLEPRCELQRLGGLLRTLSTREVYDTILDKMQNIVLKDPSLFDDYYYAFVTYEEVFNQYNSSVQFN